MNEFKLPLFPLHTVLFPGGPLPLRIFETRYLDMVSYCMRKDCGFGICLIREGREVGEVAKTHDIGTIAKIVDWGQRNDGLLGIDVVGQERFRIVSSMVQSNGLTESVIEPLPEELPQEIPADHLSLTDLLEQILTQLQEPYTHVPTDFDNAVWVSHRLAELLPMSLQQRQALLELNDPLERLAIIERVLKQMNVKY